MPWTEITRPQHERDCARYASDKTDAEWVLIEPAMLGSNRIGRPRETDLREAVNALLYIASTGCQWRFLPKEFPPFSTVQKHLYRWRDDGLLGRINHALVAAAREKAGRDAQPTAGVIDGQGVKTTESGGVSDYDGAKKVKGRKRHILTDTQGFILAVIVHAADIQDRDGAPAVLNHVRFRLPWMRHVVADGGYAGRQLRVALTKIGDWKLDIIKRSDHAKGFHVLPRRWVVKRTLHPRPAEGRIVWKSATPRRDWGAPSKAQLPGTPSPTSKP